MVTGLGGVSTMVAGRVAAAEALAAEPPAVRAHAFATDVGLDSVEGERAGEAALAVEATAPTTGVGVIANAVAGDRVNLGSPTTMVATVEAVPTAGVEVVAPLVAWPPLLAE